MTNDEIKHLMRKQWATAILIAADFERIRNITEAAVLAERERIFKEYGIDPKKNETNS